MDMQPKVIFTIHRPYTEPLICEAKMDTSIVVFSEIKVNEYDRVDITFHCPHDEDAILRIETFDNEEVIEIKPSDSPMMIMNGNNTEHMLVPGHYQFEVITKDKRYCSYYYVKSKDFSDESLINLRLYLEKLLNGLSYDLIKQRLGMATPISEINPTLLQLFQFLDKHKQNIQQNLEMIMNDPILDLRGIYKITHISRRTNQKSIRWQAQKGGQKNSLSINPRLYYEKHAQSTSFNIENQWVRYIIKYFLQSLRKLELSFQKESQQISKKIDYQENKLEQTRKQLQGSLSFGYEKTLDSLRNTERRILGRIKGLKNEKGIYLKHKHFLRQVTYFFTEHENSHWIQSLPAHRPKKITQRLLKDYRYRKLYALYKELFKLESRKVESNLSGIQFRRTWQLFEYYNVGITIDILRDNGYKWVDGWLANKDNPNQHIGTLPPDTILRFQKENSNHYIEVAYDTELESTILDRSYSRYFNYSGRRPDIRITIFRNSGSLYSEEAGLIIESKCRRHKYIINEQIDPDIKWQLKDFWDLEYFDAMAAANGEIPVKKPIKQVIVLYPKQNGMKPVKSDHIYGDSMLYIQIEPNDPDSDEKPFGYNSLKERVDEFLSQVKESEGSYVE
ncbi:MAG TPA: DUF2357 domain-containing protein [Bacillales bacterium]|nr:DUF2357 domain-containing protein [Bacillales bacterium]